MTWQTQGGPRVHCTGYKMYSVLLLQLGWLGAFLYLGLMLYAELMQAL